MKDTFDYSKEYGIVLEGGGAKGAYQIGVWKALKECGVKVKGVAGVSVGALNGVLMCMDDYEVAEQIWSNITYSQVMDVDDGDMRFLLEHDLKKINLGNLTSLTKTSAKAVTSGGLDITPLRNLIESCVDEQKVRESALEFYMGTLNLSELRGMEIDAKNLSEGEIKNYLIASASLPVFKQEKFQGKTYLDGGMVNNVPIDMLIKRGYKDIIVVRIFGIGVERKVKIPDDVSLIEISPRVELGSILEFEPKKTKRNIKIGYYDGMRLLKGLEGKIYYLDQVYSQEEHLKLILNFHSTIKMAWLEYFKEDYSNEDLYQRRMFEVVLPSIAERLGLSKNWTYTEIYLSMLELAAKSLKILKYHIYTEEEFICEIQKNYNRFEHQEIKTDLFTALIIKTVGISGADSVI